jgi:biopolymer transport protein ExbD
MIGSAIYQKRRVSMVPRLNLVALMDIFTILVFFLLINSGEAQKIENAKFIELPDSISGITPHNELFITVDDEMVWIGDKAIVSIAEVTKSINKPSELLVKALDAHKASLGELGEYEQKNGLPVTILGNKEVPFALLKTVMASCQQSGFREISLAVNQVIPNSFAVSNGTDLVSRTSPDSGE